MRRFVLAIVPLCIATAASAQETGSITERWKKATAALRQDLQAAKIVGGSYCFVRKDHVPFWEHWGLADIATKRRVDQDTIFHWASITKTMTGIATLQLRNRKKLKLDDRIVDHVPELRKVHSGEWDVGKVTIRHLLSHSSGFRETTFPWGDKKWHPYEPATWEQLAGMLPYTRLHFEPGSRYSYSNPGIVFVGRVIEQITKEDFEVHVDKNILKPLGMHRSFFDTTPYHLLKHRSNNYSVVDGKLVANGLDLDTGITVSNGGLNAPITDMIRYVRFLNGVGDRALYDGILPRRSLEEMWKPHQKAAKAGEFERSMALTFFVYERDGWRVIGHTGSQKAFQCFFLADPAAQTAVIAAFNSASSSEDPRLRTRAIMLRFMQTALDELLPVFRKR